MYRVMLVAALAVVLLGLAVGTGGVERAQAADTPCIWDMSGDGEVGGEDLIIFILAGGVDFDGDGSVTVRDLIDLLRHWGDCPPGDFRGKPNPPPFG